MKRLLKFKSITEYQKKRNENYSEPWLSLIRSNKRTNYNKRRYEKIALETPLTFRIQSSGTIGWAASFSAESKTIEYSKDSGTTWTEITSVVGGEQINVVAGETVMFRGNITGNYVTATTGTGEAQATVTLSSYFTSNGAKFSLDGNIMSLAYYDNFIGRNTLENTYAFYRIFYGNTGLTDASRLQLPATTLTNGCYALMFNGCTNMLGCPNLPATTLANNCYSNMFNACTNIVTPPDLPADTLAAGCYQQMFRSCTSLTEAPELPATVLPNGCYYRMFLGCTGLKKADKIAIWDSVGQSSCWMMFYSCTGLADIPEVLGHEGTVIGASACTYMYLSCSTITVAPELPAKTLNTSCYRQMFQSCTSLQEWAGEFAPVTFGDYSCCYMFLSCTNLTKIPDSIGTSASTMSDNSCALMFEDCISLTKAPELPSLNLAYACYQGMFYGCSGLVTSCSILPATETANACYFNLFRDCVNLRTYPILCGQTLTTECYRSMLENCYSLSAVPKDYLPVTTLAEKCYRYMFMGCHSLTTLPDLPATALTLCCYEQMFQDCWSLSAIPVNYLPATTLANNCYASMFQHCSGLTSAPELPATTLTEVCYAYMFDGCTSLAAAPELPATALTKYCYNSMFRGCTSLTSAPNLSATTLAEQCYNGMFNGCTNLNYIKCLATDISASLCTSGWVYNISANGTFVKNPSMSSWTTGIDGIPDGWAVQDATL